MPPPSLALFSRRGPHLLQPNQPILALLENPVQFLFLGGGEVAGGNVRKHRNHYGPLMLGHLCPSVIRYTWRGVARRVHELGHAHPKDSRYLGQGVNVGPLQSKLSVVNQGFFCSRGGKCLTRLIFCDSLIPMGTVTFIVVNASQGAGLVVFNPMPPKPSKGINYLGSHFHPILQCGHSYRRSSTLLRSNQI